MSKIINFTVTPNGVSPTVIQDGGIAGEIGAVTLKFTLNGLSIGANDRFRIDATLGDGGFYSSEHLTLSAGAITFPLPYEITAPGGICRMHLVITGFEGGVESDVLYSFPVSLRFLPSPVDTDGYNGINKTISGMAAEAEASAAAAGESASSAASSASGASSAATRAESAAASAENDAASALISKDAALRSAAEASSAKTGADMSATAAAASATAAASSKTDAVRAASDANGYVTAAANFSSAAQGHAEDAEDAATAAASSKQWMTDHLKVMSAAEYEAATKSDDVIYFVY